MSIKQKLVLGLVACMALLAAATALLVGVGTERAVRLAALQAVEAAGAGLAATERADVEKLDATLLALAANPALAEAYQARDRGRLLAVATPIFERLRRSHDVTHFYVHDPAPARTCFVRVHKPSEFGEVVERATLTQAIEKRGRGAGKELGKTAFALRVVEPWLVDGKVIGYLELGEEVDHFLSRLKAQTGDDYAMLVEKRFLDEQAWRATYGDRKPWGAGEVVVVDDTTGDPSTLAGATVADLPPGGRLVDELERGGKVLARGVVPLKDATGATVGGVVVLHDITALHDALLRVRSGVLVMLLAVAIVMTLLILFLVERLVFARLSRMTETLEDLGARLAGGEYDVAARAPSGPNDEIGRFEEFFGRFLTVVGGLLKELTAHR
ncbi:MAG TPA: cache domain-containing protein [Anaeromyxobacteraceae bacterium]|nr:cache domain-containing protein [Anaeromyxobacteraceae bacterium]